MRIDVAEEIKREITKESVGRSLAAYAEFLLMQELQGSTVQKYINDIRRMIEYELFGEVITKEYLMGYKEYLKQHYRMTSVNSYLRSVNRYLQWAGEEGMMLKTERIQKKSSLNNILELEEYERLLHCARALGREKCYCIMRTLASTGIRVGELSFVTCEALRQREIVICHKGKTRKLLLTDKLVWELLMYCGKKGIQEGYVFCRRAGEKPLDVSGIWRMLKRLSREAGVDPVKVYPHSFRHLFAKTYMRKVGNLAVLADLLGHSSIETTRIYTLETVSEQRISLESLGL